MASSARGAVGALRAAAGRQTGSDYTNRSAIKYFDTYQQSIDEPSFDDGVGEARQLSCGSVAIDPNLSKKGCGVKLMRYYYLVIWS